MAFVKTGKLRTLNLTIKRTGNDGSISDPYLVLDGKSAFGTFSAITADDMQKMSDYDFNVRLDSWLLHVESEYSLGQTFGDSAYIARKYAKGQVVRLVNPADKQYQATIYPSIALQDLTITIEDPFNNITYVMEIPGGSHSSNVITLDAGSTSTAVDIDQYSANITELTKSYLGNDMYYVNFSDLGIGAIQYPLPY